jgi:hypothetical protein
MCESDPMPSTRCKSEKGRRRAAMLIEDDIVSLSAKVNRSTEPAAKSFAYRQGVIDRIETVQNGRDPILE